MGNERGLGLHLSFVCVFLVAVINTCLGAGNISVSVVCSEKERLALLNFKHSVTDESKTLSSWIGNDCCLWEGIHCDSSTGSVDSLHLRGVYGYLVGDEVNSCLAELRHLKYLDLSGNNFGGSRIPQFIGSFKQLTYLNLSRAGFQGIVPHHIGNLSNLEVLDLGSNYNMMVDDMAWTSGLPLLEHLELIGLDLSGAKNLDMVIYMIPSLKELSLTACRLSNADVGPFLNSSRKLSNLRHLDLSSNYFKGPFPLFLHNMTSLAFLDLSSNPSLAGNFENLLNMIPSLSELHLLWCGLDKTFLSSPHLNITTLSNIQHLDLSQNYIEGIIPSYFTNMSSLRVLDLSWNQLNGSIPDALGKLTSLTYLNLRLNRLTGPIPTSLGGLVSLQEFIVYSNMLSGTVPVSVGQLAKLRSLDISNNSLEGVVSESHFANLSMLKELEASYNNKLTFNVSPEWIPPFQLESLYLSSCKITNGFPQWLRNQRKLVSLKLSNATITGALPTWLRKMPIIQFLDLSHNKLIGPLTNLPNEANLNVISYVEEVLLLANNLFNESIPRSLCRRIDLEVLDLSRNRLTGEIPKCIGNLQILGVMIFSSNRLSGVIPSSMGRRISSLVWLNLNNNNLSGELPRELGNLQSLSVLDLGDNNFSGHIPKSFGRKLSDLVVLRLHKNKFTGRIPRSLCKTSNLQILDVGNNKLTGTIPRCLGELDAMVNSYPTSELPYFSSGGFVIQVINGVNLEYTTTLGLVYNMDLSCNKLVGIPVELTRLSMLLGLNLSDNRLSGGIPDAIGNMTALFSLDLSGNQLTGTIPPTMAALTFLSHLNLSDNNLRGQIPTGRQLQTLTDPSIYGGNKGLCGAPLPNKCSDPTKTERSKKKEEAGDDEPAEEWLFYMFIVSGFGSGFWGVIGVLLFNKEWRRKLFMFAEETMDKIYVVVMVRVTKINRGRREAT